MHYALIGFGIYLLIGLWVMFRGEFWDWIARLQGLFFFLVLLVFWGPLVIFFKFEERREHAESTQRIGGDVA